MTLEESIKQKRNETIGVTDNPILDILDINFAQSLDNEQTDSFLIEVREKVKQLLNNSTIAMSSKEYWSQIFETYNEGFIYTQLKNKVNFIEHIPEQPNKNTPDFKIQLNKEEYFIEMKSLQMANSMINYSNIQKDSLDMNIDMENQLKSSQIAFGDMVIQPQNKGNVKTKLGRELKYNSSNVEYSINIILDKIEQNLKTGQFEQTKPTLLLVDLRLIGCIGTLPDLLKQIYIQKVWWGNKKEKVSSSLWNIAFGTETSKIYWANPDSLWEKGNNNLERNGILTSYKNIAGIIFQIEFCDKEKTSFVGFTRNRHLFERKKYKRIKNILKEICNNNVCTN